MKLPSGGGKVKQWWFYHIDGGHHADLQTWEGVCDTHLLLGAGEEDLWCVFNMVCDGGGGEGDHIRFSCGTLKGGGRFFSVHFPHQRF